ncbi:MAG: sulfite exporter TauE/SafE family protein [Gemmatimonadaceae bacterium]|nr:sulfite exporter TauE/SafE family protein [Gemmatimonadaceae bacterium]
MTLLGLIFALLIGLSLGLLGAGGSIVTVPVFTYVLGYPAKSAIAMTLPVVAVACAVGALSHWREGRVKLDVALRFGLVAVLTSFAAARFSPRVSAETQLAILGFVILAGASSMFRPPPLEGAERRAPRPAWVVVLAGALVGVLTGLAGVGGGFVIVPALVLLARLPMKEAVGTSLAVIVMNTAAGFVGYVGLVDIDWMLLLPFTAVAVIGTLIGTRLVSHVPVGALRRGFAVLLVAIGVLVLWQSGVAG